MLHPLLRKPLFHGFRIPQWFVGFEYIAGLFQIPVRFLFPPGFPWVQMSFLSLSGSSKTKTRRSILPPSRLLPIVPPHPLRHKSIHLCLFSLCRICPAGVSWYVQFLPPRYPLVKKEEFPAEQVLMAHYTLLRKQPEPTAKQVFA